MNGGRQRAHRADGSDVEDDSLPLPDHLFVDRLGDGKQTVDVGVNHFVPGAIGRGGEVVAAIDGRVVDEDVDAAPLLDQFARQSSSCPTRSITETLALNARRPCAFDLLTHLGGEVVARVVAESHIGAFARKNLANCRTNATRSAGYERALSFKQKTHLAMFLLKNSTGASVYLRAD